MNEDTYFVFKSNLMKAIQWTRNGDHYDDNSKWIWNEGRKLLSEGKIVRRFRDPDQPATETCDRCNYLYHDHGWIDQAHNEEVCPGDWIVEVALNEYQVYSPKDFYKVIREVEYAKVELVEEGTL